MKSNNGIILAGGTGSRLLPLTQVINKHLLSVNGKFIIDYPLNTLKNLGCENITVVLGGNHYSQVTGYLGDGSRYGLNLNYVYQAEPKGIAQAINLCKRFVDDTDNFYVCLGDNVFENTPSWDRNNSKAKILLANHQDLKSFGVASLSNNEILKIEEKPKLLNPQYQNFAISGCYCFNYRFFDYFKKLTPSARGEYEITDIILQYLESGSLSYSIIDGLWSDAGTHESIAFINNYFYQKEHK